MSNLDKPFEYIVPPSPWATARARLTAWGEAHPRAVATIQRAWRFTGLIAGVVINVTALLFVGSFVASAVGQFVGSGGLVWWIAQVAANLSTMPGLDMALGAIAMSTMMVLTVFLCLVYGITAGIHLRLPDEREQDVETDVELEEIMERLGRMEQTLNGINVGLFRR